MDVSVIVPCRNAGRFAPKMSAMLAAQDFAVVRAMVFLSSVLYMTGLLLTDLCYALVDPRVRFS